MSDDKKNSEYNNMSIKMSIDPTILEQNKKQWTRDGIVRFGVNDDQFDKMIDQAIRSTTHGSIVTSASRLIYAKGLNKDIIDKNDLRSIIYDFYLFGQCSIQVIEGKMFHIPMNFIRSEERDEKNKINNYFFSTDWQDASIEPIKLSNWVYNQKKNKSVYHINPYVPKAFYYSLPEYMSAEDYIDLEAEISNYHLQNVKKGFSAYKVINIIGPEPDDLTKQQIARQYTNHLTGTDGERFIISFGEDKDQMTTVENITIENATERLKYSSELSESNIIKAHHVTSPLLLGLRPSAGFSSNADEMEVASKIYFEQVIQPAQNYVLDALSEISGEEDLRFVQLDEEVTEVNDIIESINFEKNLNPHLKSLIAMGVDNIDGYNLVDENKVEFENHEYNFYKETILDKIINLASTGRAHPDSKSKQDNEDIIIRYRYKGNKNPERTFCKAMMKSDKLYRIEDIKGMKNLPVNPGFGKNGTDIYDILLWKGGGMMSDNFPNGTCNHYWQREIYLREGKKIDPDKLTKISTNEARRMGYKVPVNNSKVSIAPHNMK